MPLYVCKSMCLWRVSQSRSRCFQRFHSDSVRLSTLCGKIRETYKRKLKTNFLSKPMHCTFQKHFGEKSSTYTSNFFPVLCFTVYTHTQFFFRENFYCFFFLFAFICSLIHFFFPWLETLNFTCTGRHNSITKIYRAK